MYVNDSPKDKTQELIKKISEKEPNFTGITISNYLPYGSAVISVHKFPTEISRAKYIIITEPFESISVEKIL